MKSFLCACSLFLCVLLLATASANAKNVTYLADWNAAKVGATLYEVDDAMNLTELATLGEFKGVALAVKPSGKEVVVINTADSHLGNYDPFKGTFIDLGVSVNDAGSLVRSVGSATFNNHGKLIVASGYSDKLYSLDSETGDATFIGKVMYDGSTLGFNGGDIAYAPNGDMYLWTNDFYRRGLYRVEDPDSYVGTDMVADFLVGGEGIFVTGISVVVKDGVTLVVASESVNSTFNVYSTTDPIELTQHEMKINHAVGDLGFGPAPVVMTVDKSSSADEVNSGELVTYTYVVAATEDLYDAVAEDDKCPLVLGPNGDDDNNGALSSEETWIYTCTMPLAQTTTNTVTVTAVREFNDQVVTANSSYTVSVVQSGCVMPTNYWGNHCDPARNNYNVTCNNLPNLPEVLDIMQANNSNYWDRLAKQYYAVILNSYHVPLPTEIAEAMEQALTLLTEENKQILADRHNAGYRELRAEFAELLSVLRDLNKGVYGDEGAPSC